MTSPRQRAAPAENGALRQALYGGEIVHLPATAASLRLCQEVQGLLREALGDAPREAQFQLTGDDFFQRIGGLRRALFTEERFHRAVMEVMASAGFDPGDNAFDPLRLRVVTHEGFNDPRAAPVYHPHRDTWYAHPQCLLTFWIALHDTPETETFVFYPACFSRPVPNSSSTFDYDRWVQDGWGLKIGWQDKDAGSKVHYPGAPADLSDLDPGPPSGFSAATGEILIFSGAHFHRTLPNRSGRTRFSLDFRSAHLPDHAHGLGAPNVDNQSRGSALRDYVRPPRI